MGSDSNNTYLNDLWQYYPCSDTIPLSLDRISNNTDPGINLYPNPSNGIIHLIRNGIGKQSAEFKVIDITGRAMISKKIILSSLESTTIDGTGLANGMYLYRVVTSDDRQLSTGKFIILK